MMPTIRLLLFAIGLTAISVMVSLQGWRSRLLSSDSWTAAKSADAFIESGEIPSHGCLSSLRSYIPPGSNLVIIPGVFLFKDQRLYEVPGAALFTFGTLVGLFLLCRLYFGERNAWVSVIFYAVSALGLVFATSLWPRGHPFFAVWFFYFLGKYHIRKSQLSLALALLTWTVGMYYFMELAPLLVAIPVVLIATRRRLSLTLLIALCGVVLVSSVLWMPYLRFEAQRGYRDLASLISREPIVSMSSSDIPSRYSLLYAQSGQPFSAGTSERQGTSRILVDKAIGMVESLQSNFSADTLLPGAGGALLALCILGLGVANPQIRDGLLRRHWKVTCFLLVGIGIVSLCFFEAGTLMRVVLHHSIQPATASQMSSVGSSLLVFLLVLILWSMFQSNLIERCDIGNIQRRAAPREVMLLTLCFVTAWASMVILIPGIGNGRRLWWAWPIQVAYITCFLGSLKRRPAFILTMAVLLIIASNQTILNHFRDWHNNGWGGKDAEVLHLLDVVHAAERPTDSVSVGYIIPFPAWFPDFWKIDSGYKVGTELDRYLWERYKVRNLSVGREGIGTNDKYRIIQTDIKHKSVGDYIVVGGVNLDGYEEIAQVAGYSLLRKARPPAFPPTR